MVGARELFWARANDVRLHGPACGRHEIAWVHMGKQLGLIGRDPVLASGGGVLSFSRVPHQPQGHASIFTR